MEEETAKEFELFKDAMKEDNLEVQIDITKSLSALAKHLGQDITRRELLPFIKENLDVHDEILLNLSEQLNEFIPLIGGYEYSRPLLDLLMKLCNNDETIVRSKTVETLKNIAANLSNELAEELFVPVVEGLANVDWFTSKCSAAALFPAVYKKVKPEKQTDLRNTFRALIQDDSPIVRKEATIHLVELLPMLEKEHIINDFIPVFDNISKDPMDSVRLFAVDVARALAPLLSEAEIDEYIFKILESWASDQSWRIRQKLALCIGAAQKAIPQNKFRGKFLALFQKLIKDSEPEVRILAARSLFNYCENFRKTYEGQPKLEENFEPVFQQSILPQIKLLLADPIDEVRLAISTNVLMLSVLLRQDFFKIHILPLIVDILENEHSMAIQSNMLQNLNYLPSNVDLTQSLHSIKNVVRSLIINSQSHWRTRRSLLVAFMHVAKFAPKEYFSENLKIYYAALLGDPVFAVRRTAVLILPLLAKQYGMTWTFHNMIPFFMMFTKDIRYLYRYIPLFGMKELLTPNLDATPQENGRVYLNSFKVLIERGNGAVEDKAIRTLARINTTTEKIRERLEEQTCKDILSLNKSIYDFRSDKISLYADETLDIFKTSCKCDMFTVEEQTILQGTYTYLEGLLSLIYREFLMLILGLFDDKIVNIQIRSIYTLNEIDQFVKRLEEELKQTWVKDALQKLNKEELEELVKEVELELIQRILRVDEELVNTELMDVGSNGNNSVEQKVPDIKIETTKPTESKSDDQNKEVTLQQEQQEVSSKEEQTEKVDNDEVIKKDVDTVSTATTKSNDIKV